MSEEVREARVLAGRYELRRLLGRGGMAEVYAAHDRTLDREVAIKLLLERFREDEGFTRRFQDEARHVARLNHPNLVAVYDTGTDHGQPFIVMELVRGRSLQQAIEAGGLTEDRALEVVAEVCAALAYAHDRGLIHRDIKPGNILLSEDGGVKVADFGIARTVDNETVTRTAAVLGTAAYLSPEQAQGLDVDPRSDLYSLGVVLYEALTGMQPFGGDSAVTVAYQHVQEAPRPPRDLDPGISPAAEAVTMRALAKNPTNRYQHAGEMRDDVANARVGAPVAAPAVLSADETALLEPTPSARPTRTHEQERRRRAAGYTLLVLLAIGAIAAAVLLAGSIFESDAPTRIPVPDVVDQPQDDAEDLLEERGFEVGRVTEEASDTVEEGRVTRQSPGADTEAAEGSEIDLWISTGPELTTVPEIVGEAEEEALRRIREAGLIPNRQDRVPDADVPEGHVVSSDPPAGQQVRTDSQVGYVLSSGEELATVPSVVQQSEAAAILRLEDRELDYRIEREFHSVVAEGYVISQDHEPGDQVPVGTIVTIVVSEGPEPEPEDPEEPEEPEIPELPPEDPEDPEDPLPGDDPPGDDPPGDDPPPEDGPDTAGDGGTQ